MQQKEPNAQPPIDTIQDMIDEIKWYERRLKFFTNIINNQREQYSKSVKKNIILAVLFSISLGFAISFYIENIKLKSRLNDEASISQESIVLLQECIHDKLKFSIKK